MRIAINSEDPRPVYEQVCAQIIHAVEVGLLPEDTKLSSIKALALELRVNPNTIAHAYRELERRGFLYTRRGEGSFVKASRGGKHRNSARRSVEMLASQIVQSAETAGMGLRGVQDLIREIWNRRKKGNE